MELDTSWWKLGKALEVNNYHLQSIEYGNSGVGTASDALMMVIDVWLKKDPGASWKKLADAVEKCGYTATAKNIREKEIAPPTGM